MLSRAQERGGSKSVESPDYLLPNVWKETDMKEINPQADRVHVAAQSKIPPFTLTLSPGAIVPVTVDLFLFSHFDHLVYSREEAKGHSNDGSSF